MCVCVCKLPRPHCVGEGGGLGCPTFLSPVASPTCGGSLWLSPALTPHCGLFEEHVRVTRTQYHVVASAAHQTQLATQKQTDGSDEFSTEAGSEQESSTVGGNTLTPCSMKRETHELQPQQTSEKCVASTRRRQRRTQQKRQLNLFDLRRTSAR